MICYLHLHLINMPIYNTIINIITFKEMVTFQHKNSSVSTWTSASFTPTNDEGRSLFSPIHENIKSSGISQTQSRYVRYASDAMKSQIKSLAKKWYSDILGYLLKDKDTKEFLLAMDISITLSTQETIRQNKCQMRFIDKLVLKQESDKKLMINYITC